MDLQEFEKKYIIHDPVERAIVEKAVDEADAVYSIQQRRKYLGDYREIAIAESVRGLRKYDDEIRGQKKEVLDFEKAIQDEAKANHEYGMGSETNALREDDYRPFGGNGRKRNTSFKHTNFEGKEEEKLGCPNGTGVVIK